MNSDFSLNTALFAEVGPPMMSAQLRWACKTIMLLIRTTLLSYMAFLTRFLLICRMDRCFRLVHAFPGPRNL